MARLVWASRTVAPMAGVRSLTLPLGLTLVIAGLVLFTHFPVKFKFRRSIKELLDIRLIVALRVPVTFGLNFPAKTVISPGATIM